MPSPYSGQQIDLPGSHRLDPKAKRTLSAAAVIGLRFGLNLLTELGIEPVVDGLVAAQLI